MEYSIILGSKSEIRRNLLKNAGVKFKVVESGFDETQLKDTIDSQACEQEEIEDLVKKLSYEKAKIISDRYNKNVIIGCDQILFFDNRIFNKPNNFEESYQQLRELSGKNHKLITATICVKESREIWSYVSVQNMRMRKLSDSYIEKYIDSVGDIVLNILGGYEIEGKGINLFESIGDDLFSIQGISILQLINFLREAGYIE